MSKVRFEISTSLDGYVTASGVRAEEPMGDGGQLLHEWAFGADERGRELLAENQSSVGASIAGRRTYDLSVPWWGPDGPSGSARLPLFVVSHSEPEQVPDGGVYTFVDSPEEALEQARAAAGEKDVDIMGADIGQQFIRAGRVDEIHVHLVPLEVARAVAAHLAPHSVVRLSQNFGPRRLGTLEVGVGIFHGDINPPLTDMTSVQLVR